MKTRPSCKTRKSVARISADEIRKFISILSGVDSREPIGQVPFFVTEEKGKKRVQSQHTWLNMFSRAEKMIMGIQNKWFEQFRSRNWELLENWNNAICNIEFIVLTNK